jgi:hypothetical protein
MVIFSKVFPFDYFFVEPLEIGSSAFIFMLRDVEELGGAFFVKILMLE